MIPDTTWTVRALCCYCWHEITKAEKVTARDTLVDLIRNRQVKTPYDLCEHAKTGDRIDVLLEWTPEDVPGIPIHFKRADCKKVYCERADCPGVKI